MEWQLYILIIFGSLVVGMAIGLPVAFSFMIINVVGAYLLLGGTAGLTQLTISIFDSLASFSLMPVVMFILMGELMFHSGMAPKMMDALDKWLGRLPGRLSLITVAGGTLFACMTGSSMGSTAMLGTVMMPEMKKRKYANSMSVGPIIGCGGLAMMIPPSNLAVIFGALADISIGKILIAIVLPGFLMAFMYAVYIIIRCKLQPSVAPAYEKVLASLFEKIVFSLKFLLPLGLIIFLVLGVIFLGIATPTEASALGVAGTFILGVCYGGVNWSVIKKSISGTLEIAAMTFMIMATATAFSQITVFSGISQGLAEFATGLPVSPMLILAGMQIVLLFLGCFMDVVAIMMITIPIFMPIVSSLRFDPVWFSVIFLLNIEMANLTPPFGMNLFVMKGVSPEIPMKEIYTAGLPFLGCNLILMVLIMLFPPIALWLPSLMR